MSTDLTPGQFSCNVDIANGSEYGVLSFCCPTCGTINHNRIDTIPIEFTCESCKSFALSIEPSSVKDMGISRKPEGFVTLEIEETLRLFANVHAISLEEVKRACEQLVMSTSIESTSLSFEKLTIPEAPDLGMPTLAELKERKRKKKEQEYRRNQAHNNKFLRK